MYRLTGFLLFIVLVQGCAVSPTSQEQLFGKDRRIALVIGNADYQEPEGYSSETHLLFEPIPSATKDADGMTKKLRRLGFSVISIKDANKQEMQSALNQFETELKIAKDTTVGFFYFSGHGLGDNENKETYLIPTDHEPLLKEEVNETTLNTQFITQTDVYKAIKKADNKLNFVILDNCRDMGQTAIDNAKGIVAMLKGPDGKINVLKSGANPGKDRPPRTILAYAAETNKPSLGMKDPNANSAYTKQLLEYISIPSLSISELFERVSDAVVEETQDEQIPYFDLGEVSGKELDFVFKKERVQIMPSPP